MAYVRRQGRPATLITFDQASVAATMRVLKAADKNLYDEMRKVLLDEAKNVKAAQAEAVQGLDVSGARGRSASIRRAGFALARATKGDVSKVTTRRLRSTIKRSGLRDSAARALKIEYRERATSSRPFLGVRIRMSASSMPPDQRRLPKHMNYGRWRHPVFGDRDAWVTQTALPVGWFDETFDGMKRGVSAAMSRAMLSAYRRAGLLK